MQTGREVEQYFRWPRGRAARLAKAGKIPFIVLPDGEIRFDLEKIKAECTRVPSKRAGK